MPTRTALRIATWNVNGIRAVAGKDRLPWQAIPGAPEVIGVQETKAQEGQLAPAIAKPEGWHAFWHSAKKPGYSSTALFCRQAPDEYVAGLGDAQFDAEGRVQTVRIGDLAIVNAYFPNSQEAGKRLGYKLAFCAAMEEHLAGWLDRGCHTILIGDYNIAHRPIDLARPRENEGTAGYLPEERAWMDRYLELGYHDVFRERHPELTAAYTWWSQRGGARGRNVGWRIDYATVSAGLRDRVKGIEHHPAVEGSDHCPVSIAIG
jgi:exodeoxyribonuclease III